MKIESSSLAASLLVESSSKPKPAEVGRPAPGPSFVTNLNKSSASSSHDIDMEKVNEIRLAIKEGRLEIDTDRIAGAIIASMNEFL